MENRPRMPTAREEAKTGKLPAICIEKRCLSTMTSLASSCLDYPVKA